VRIVLVTQEEPFYLPAALEAFIKARREDLVAVIILPTFNESQVQLARRLYDFYGPCDFIRLLGRFFMAKIVDRVNRFQPLTRPFSIKELGQRYRLPLLFPRNINEAKFVAELRQNLAPDLMISLAASQVLKREILAVPKWGCINLHSAPLPKYQGLMPNFWVMVHQEKSAAVTVHYMVEKLDAGDIILQLPVPIQPRDSLDALIKRSKQIGVQALLQAVAQIENGTVTRQPLDLSKATYFSFPRRGDADKLRSLGHSLL